MGKFGIPAALGMVAGWGFGWGWSAGLVYGIALSVASTVVLIRVLTDNRVLDSTAGHVAVGWLIVEDVLTVVVLVLVPALAGTGGGDPAHGGVGRSLQSRAAFHTRRAQ